MRVTLLNYCRGQRVVHSDIVILKGQLVSSEICEESQGGSITPKATTPGGGGGGDEVTYEIWLLKSGAGEEAVENVPYRSYKSRFVAILKLGLGANQIRFFDKKTGTVFDEFELTYSPEEVTNEHYVKILHVISAKSQKGEDQRRIEERQKLKLGISLVQTLFGEKLYENGFDRRSFQLKGQRNDGSGECLNEFEIGLDPEEISLLSTSSLWEYIAKEIRSRGEVWNEKYKYVAFVAHSWKAHYEHNHVKHGESSATSENEGTGEKLALGGGGLAVIGTSFLEVWPDAVGKVLDTLFSTKALWTMELEHSAARFGAVEKTEGSLYSTSLGSVMHEMGHVFDLGHTDGGLMGTQFNRVDTCLSPVLSYPPVCELFRSKLGSDLCPLLRPKVGLPSTDGCLSEDLLSIGISCATLLYFHRWFQPGKLNSRTGGQISTEEGLKIVKNKIVSKSGTLVTLQVRDIEDERLLKSWTFIEKSGGRMCDATSNPEPVSLSSLKEFTLAKNHIPIPVCQRGDSNKALVVVEDCEGNLVKTVVSRDSLSESFTVIRRRT